MSTFAPGTDPAYMAEQNRRMYGAVTPSAQPTSYTPDQIRSYGDSLLAGGGDYRGLLGAAREYGVSNDDLAAAYGMTPQQGNNFLASQGLYDFMQPASQSQPPAQPGTPAWAAPQLQQYQRNPYLDQIATGMETQANNNLQRNLLPGIRSNAVGVGGLGGSRQGVAEGMAIGDAQAGLSSALGGLYGGDFNNSMNRNLQQYGMDQNYTLGVGGLANQRYGIDTNAALSNRGMDQNYMLGQGALENQRYATEGSQNLGNQNSWMNFYNQGRQLDQTGAMTGANIYNLANQGDWTGLKNSSDIFNTTAGNNVTATNSTNGGYDWAKMVGNAGATFQYLNPFK